VLGQGGGQEGQYPEWFKGRRDPCTSNTVKMATKTPIVWTCGSISEPDMWIADSTAMVHVSSNQDDFTLYHKYDMYQHIKAFGEGDIIADIKCEGKVTRVCLTQVMHVLDTEGKILSLKKLDQKCFKICIVAGHI